MSKLQTIQDIKTKLAKGRQILTIEELINTLSFEIEDEDNLWYSSSSLFFIGKNEAGALTIIATPAALVEGYENYPIVDEKYQNNRRIDTPYNTEKHNLRITNQEFLRLISLPEVRTLSFEDFAEHLGNSAELFNGKARGELIHSPFMKLLCGEAGIGLVDKMSEVNKNHPTQNPKLAQMPGEGLIHLIVNVLCPYPRCKYSNELSEYLGRYAVGNEYGLSMIMKHVDEGCTSYQIMIETGEPDLNRYMFK
jgi:hypothetical protein